MKKLLLAVLALVLLLPAATAEARCYGCYRGYWGGYWGWGGGWGWGWGWARPYYPYPYYGYGYGAVRWPGAGAAWTVIDTDVSPEHAEIWLDGTYIGVADDFDGNPDYLYLGKGSYKLEVRLGGYQSFSIDVKGRPGGLLTVDEWMQRVPDTPKTKDGERRVPEGGIQRLFVKKDGQTQVYDGSSEGERAETEGDGYSAEAEVWSRRQEPSPEATAPRAEGAPSGDDWRGRSAPAAPAAGSAALLIAVEPPDAAVWVDDRFVGTGADLSASAKGVPVPPGSHKITVSRPGFGEETVTAEVESGEIRRVRVVLEKD
jgi:hypothetical protein